jgi:hypothetical protein
VERGLRAALPVLAAALKKGRAWGMNRAFNPRTKRESMSGTVPPPPPEEDAPLRTEVLLGAPQPVQTTFTLPHFIRVVTVNVLVLAELCVARYMAAQNPEEFTPVFFKVFFALLVPTLILSAVVKRLMQPKEKP